MHDTFDVRKIRDTLKLTQADLAAKIGVAQGDISNWEKRKHKPSSAARKAIQNLLDAHKAGRSTPSPQEKAVA